MAAERNGNDSEDLTELLSAYLDGQLTEAERLALETRLSQDAALRRQLAQMRATVEMIRSLPTLTAPRDFRLNHIMVYGRDRRRTTAVFSFLSAAAAVVLLLAGVFLTQLSNLARQEQSLARDMSDGMQQEEIALLTTDAAQATSVPTAALLQPVPPAEDDTSTRLVEPVVTGADQQTQQPEVPLLFAAPTGTQIAAEQAAPAADAAEGEDTTATIVDQFSVAEQQRDQVTPETEAFLGAAEAATEADEEAQPTGEEADGMLLQQAAEELTDTPRPTLPPPSPTASATSTPSPTATPTATRTPAPSPAPTLAPVPSVSALDTSTIGTVLIIGAVALLAVSLFAFLLSRRR